MTAVLRNLIKKCSFIDDLTMSQESQRKLPAPRPGSRPTPSQVMLNRYKEMQKRASEQMTAVSLAQITEITSLRTNDRGKSMSNHRRKLR